MKRPVALGASVAIALAVLTGCSSSTSSSSSGAQCPAPVLAFQKLLQAVQGHVQAMTTFTEYTTLVGDATTAENQIPAHSVENPCFDRVLKPLGVALQDYATAATDWNNCSSCDSTLQGLWAKADGSLAKASQALTSGTSGQ